MMVMRWSLVKENAILSPAIIASYLRHTVYGEDQRSGHQA